MARLFGTDGIRGLANGDVLTPELAMALAGTAGARLLSGGGRPTVVVGRDTRVSGEMLEAAAVAGFTSAGCDVQLLGVVPTPVVAHATAHAGAVLGLMITASHNPMADNGLKLFGDGGFKLPDEVEDQLEADVGARWARVTGAAVGRVRQDPAAVVAAYEADLLTAASDLTGLTVVVDCAYGAAGAVAPEVYRRAGATVVALHDEPLGHLINDGVGATHLGPLQAAVVEHGADLGIAHDGDADRCLAVDATGQQVDGDQLLGLLALSLKEQGRLAKDVLVATVMSNLGLHQAMAAHGITVRTTSVGDRYVLEELRDGGFSLGGEQSGHVILTEHATTGDGLLTALALMSRMASSGRSLADLAAVVRRLPQVLVNVTADRSRASSDDVLAAVAAEEAALGGAGRVLLRPSGTEPLVRVMVEAPSQEQAEQVAQRLARVVAG